MNTEREDRHGEYWPSPFAITFNVKKVWAWLVSLFLLAGVANAQTSYCGVDVNKDLTPYGGVAKVTLSNMCTYSEQLDNAGWTKANVTISANSVVAPDGTLTADTVTNTVIDGAHTIYSAGITVVAASVYRMSVYLKYSNHPYIVVRSQSPATSLLNINMSTGTIASTGSTILSHSMQSVGNGWYRVQFTYTKAAGVTDHVTITIANSAYAESWNSTSSEAVYAWGALLQLASAPADYIATTSAAVTLGPLCPVGYTQSLTDPSRCFIVGPVTSRTIRTW